MVGISTLFLQLSIEEAVADPENSELKKGPSPPLSPSNENFTLNLIV